MSDKLTSEQRAPVSARAKRKSKAAFDGRSIEWTDAERATLQEANAAAGAIQRGLGIEERLKIGRGLIILERDALVLSGRNRPGKGPYKRAWETLAEGLPSIAAIKHQSERSRHQWLAKNWSEVEPELQKLPPDIRMRLASPKSIYRWYNQPSPKKASSSNSERLALPDAMPEVDEFAALIERKYGTEFVIELMGQFQRRTGPRSTAMREAAAREQQDSSSH